LGRFLLCCFLFGDCFPAFSDFTLFCFYHVYSDRQCLCMRGIFTSWRDR
jgi:hypothetical protein